MVKNHISLQLHIGGSVRILVIVLPGPESRALPALRQLPVWPAHRIHQLHIAIVHLRLLIHELKDPVRPCQGHDNAVKLHAHLVDGHVEGFVKVQEAGQPSQGQPGDSRDGQNTPCHRADHIAQIAQLCIHRHHNVGELVGLVGALKQMVVEPVKLIQTLLFMAEHLHHLLAGHGLLNTAVQSADGLLLFHKIPAAQAPQFLCYPQHDTHHQQRHQRQGHIQNDHIHQNPHHRDDAVDHLRYALADHLPEGVNVVGVHGHNVPVGMGVEIFNGQGLHLLKHIVPDTPQAPLSYADQYPGLDKRSRHTQDIEHGHPSYGAGQRPVIGVFVPQQGHNIVVNKGPHEHGSLESGVHRCKNTNHHNHPSHRVILQSITHNPPKQPAGILNLGPGSPGPPPAGTVSAGSRASRALASGSLAAGSLIIP